MLAGSEPCVDVPLFREELLQCVAGMLPAHVISPNDRAPLAFGITYSTRRCVDFLPEHMSRSFYYDMQTAEHQSTSAAPHFASMRRWPRHRVQRGHTRCSTHATWLYLPASPAFHFPKSASGSASPDRGPEIGESTEQPPLTACVKPYVCSSGMT